MSRSIRPALATAALAALIFTLRPFTVTAAPEPARSLGSQWKVDPALEPQDTPVPPPPKPLSPVQRKMALAGAAKFVHAPTLETAPQTLEMRLTPMKPRLEDGTRIVRANRIDFIESSSEVPDGVFWMNHGDGYFISSIKMRVHSEKDKLYVGDCRVREVGSDGSPPLKSRLRVQAPGLNQDFTAVDGHIVFAFRGDAVGSTVSLYYNDMELDAYRKMAFYGCDFGKAG